MKISTIGFTQKSAERFFSLVQASGARRIVDVRLNNVSQLAGFAKRDDLKYFLKKLCGVEYLHVTELTPKKEALKAYQDKKMTWQQYEDEFLNLMTQRRIESVLDKATLDESCLLCSEDKPHHCHRRLVAEYLKKHWADKEILINHLT
jgi:uncharacterized protein (DUF488 family)